ncbi:MAG: alpha/beta hydrolase [Ktedonobacteraceae bacterium]
MLVAAGGIATLAAQVYRRPWATMINVVRAGMLFAGAREEICDVDGFPMHYYRAGRRGTPIILIHGLGGSAEGWVALLPRLSQRHRVYALDLPGFGKTPLAPEGTDLNTHVFYVECFVAALGYPRVTLVGNSLGGWIATRFAAAHPERVDRLYLLNSAGLMREGGHTPYADTREAAQDAIKRMWDYSLPVPGFILDAMIQNAQRPAYVGFIQNYTHEEELDAVLGQVQVPTTIIWGTQDHLLPLICAYDFHAGIARSTLVLLPGVGHTPQVGAAAEVARIILQDAAGQQTV